MFQTFTVGRFFDIPVGVDGTWIAVFAFATFSIAGNVNGLPYPATLGVAAGCALLLFASVIAHELAHALVARRFGVRTRSITLFLFGGVATLECEPPSPRAEVFIALAGPAMSAVLGALAYGLLVVAERYVSGRGGEAVVVAIAYLALANGMLALFNLIPAFPMDGGRVLRAAIWRARRSRSAATGAASIVGLVLAGALIVAGFAIAIGQRVWEYAWYVAIGAFLVRQCWLQLHDARSIERLERLRVRDVMDAASADDLPSDGFSLTSSASALDAVGVFRTSDRMRIAVVDGGRLAGWLRRDRVFEIVDRAA